jgi:hypothetical protein
VPNAPVTETQRFCISNPIPRIFDAARYLDAAVSAHLQGKRTLADELIRSADMPEIYEWLKPIWSNSKVHVLSAASKRQPIISKDLRAKDRMPSGNTWKAAIHQRDGYNCRFCGMPVIRSEVRKRINSAYPNAARWGDKDIEHHTAFQAMWAQYDHVVPHARGGQSDLDNMVLTCAACNFGRAEYSLEEVGVADPRGRHPVATTWDGLERFE